jgi:predicted Zn-dependent protease
VLGALGREPEADSVMQKALHFPGTDAYSVYAYGMGLLRHDKKDKAMNVFVFNQQQHPQDKFWTSLGLARGYTALGDKKNAISNWEIVLRNVPANLSNRTATYEDALKKLKEAS